MFQTINILLSAFFHAIFYQLIKLYNGRPSKGRPLANVLPYTQGNQSLMAKRLNSVTYDQIVNLIRFNNNL